MLEFTGSLSFISNYQHVKRQEDIYASQLIRSEAFPPLTGCTSPKCLALKVNAMWPSKWPRYRLHANAGLLVNMYMDCILCSKRTSSETLTLQAHIIHGLHAVIRDPRNPTDKRHAWQLVALPCKVDSDQLLPEPHR